jgi:hypothetical protein
VSRLGLAILTLLGEGIGQPVLARRDLLGRADLGIGAA